MHMRTSSAGIAIAAIAGIVALPPAAAQAQQQKVEWNYSSFGNPRALTAGYEAAARFLDEKTGGNFTMKIHYGESVSPARANLDSIKVGAVEAAHVTVSYHPGKLLSGTVLDLPFLPLPTFDALQQVGDAFHDNVAVWQEDLARWDARAWFTNVLPQFEFMGTGTPPKTLADWKGMRVRALGGQGDAMRTLGAVPTTVTAPEAYNALERGLVSAISFPYAYTFAAYRLHEIGRWFTEGMALGSVNSPSVYSITAYDALPEEWKGLLIQARPAAYAALRQAFDEADGKWIPEYEKRMTKITFTKEERDRLVDAAGRPIWDAWVKDTAAKGYPAQDLLDFVLSEAGKVAGS